MNKYAIAIMQTGAEEASDVYIGQMNAIHHINIQQSVEDIVEKQFLVSKRYILKEDNPDDDFIDLDALIKNVANSIVREGSEKSIPEILGEETLTPAK